MSKFDLIYCAGGNPRLSQIAYEEGWKLGYRSDKTIGNFPTAFIDIDYKRPNFEKHLEVVKEHHPHYATVPDLSDLCVDQQDIDRALDQYELIALYCDVSLIIPKLSGQIALLPAYVAIGYSIPSSYGGAQFPLWELAGRRVHLLGGSPRKQIQTYHHLSPIASVMSADGNMAQKMATRYGEYWDHHRWVEHPGVKLKQKDIYRECWRWSCRNIREAWSKIVIKEVQG